MLRMRLLAAHIAGALALPVAVCAQEQPLNVSGTFYSGYYSTSTRGDANQSLKFIPLGARFDIDGYYLSPDLVTFSVQPEVAVGPQASEAGIQGGNGVRLRVTLLRKRAFPLTFRYTNVQVQDVYFGSLSQISGYRLQNRTKDLGATWEVRPTKTLAMILDWGTGSVDSKSDVAQIPDYLSHQNHFNGDAKYERAGWDLEAYGHRQEQRSNLLMPIEGGTTAGNLTQKVEQYQGSARRTFFGDSEFYVDAGTQSTSSMLFTLPIDLFTRYASVNVRLMQRRRWKSSLRAAYSSNVASQLLAQAAGSLGGPGAIAPDATILLPFSHGISNLNFNGTTSVALTHGFGLFGSAERNEVLSSDQGGPLNASYFTATAGVTYAQKFGWGSVNGQYGRDEGYGSVTGQSGRIRGETYRVGAQRGSANGIIVDFDVHGSDQAVKNAQPLSNNGLAAEAGIAFPIATDIHTRLGGGWQRSLFVNSGNEFRTNGYTFRASVDHPRYQVSVSLNDSLSNSLPIYGQLLAGLGLGSGLLSPLQVIPSDYRALGFSFHSNPIRKLEVAANWTHSRQHLDGILSNDFELLNIYLTYHFRKLQLESGYIRFNQVFSLYPSMRRERFYIRVQRTTRIL